MYFRLFILLITVLFNAGIANADTTQERRVTISASIFPRIIAVDENLREKLDASGNVRLGLLYRTDKDKAVKLSKLMTRKVSNIAGNTIVFEFIDANNLDKTKLSALSGLFLVHPLSDKQLDQINEISVRKKILCFSPFEGDVERGVTAGIFIGAKIRPYFNLNNIKKSRISLKPALLRVSKTYE